MKCFSNNAQKLSTYTKYSTLLNQNIIYSFYLLNLKYNLFVSLINVTDVTMQFSNFRHLQISILWNIQYQINRIF